MKNQSQKEDVNKFESIFIEHWDEFKNTHPLYDCDQYDIPVQKMLGCGSDSNGYCEYSCMHCGKDKRRIAFTCKCCFCLSCAKVYVDNFVNQVSNNLHPGLVYRHIVLTLPEQLRIYFYQYRHNDSLLSELMRTGHRCLEDVVKIVKRQALKIGTIVVVQTHGRSGNYNPHLHIIMTNGGINETKGSWLDLGYFPYEIIHKKWQYHLFGMMKKEIKSIEMNTLINELWNKYPKGLVAHVQRGNVPGGIKGLAKYLPSMWLLLQ